MTKSTEQKTIQDFLAGKPAITLALYQAFTNAYAQIGPVSLHPAKTMIGVSNGQKRIAWITQLGRNFVHIVFPFKQAYPDNLCFQKIAQVPGDAHQFNHHFRMYDTEDLNEEVTGFMKMAYKEE